MRTTTIWRAWLLTAFTALAPGVALAQTDYAPPDPVLPLPLFSSRPEDGGLFVAGEYVMYRQTNPLKGQNIAVRGFEAVDNSVTFNGQPVPAGTFIGSHTLALDVSQVSGPNDYQPGFVLDIGYKFRDGSALTFSYLYITEHETHASATLAPPGLRVGQSFEESFLFSPVFGFTPDYSGPDNKIQNGGPQSVFGIWNGASIMTIQFLQRAQQYELNYRRTIFEQENYRLTGTMGPRFFWLWERFKWVTTDIDINGNSGPESQAQYTNIVSNRMYGAHVGCGNEWYVGHGFAVNIDLDGAMFFDSVKERAQYNLARGATGPESKRALVKYTFVPEVSGKIGMMWYPTEGIQLHAGYSGMAFFNTIGSRQPIDFNYGSTDPKWENIFLRVFDGFDFGVSLTF